MTYEERMAELRKAERQMERAGRWMMGFGVLYVVAVALPPAARIIGRLIEVVS